MALSKLYLPSSGAANPRGLESVLEFNGLRLHERQVGPDRFWITEVDGLHDADVRDAREDNPGRHGQTAFEALYGGRTITINGRVESGNINKMRELQQSLRTAFVSLSEMPLTQRYKSLHDSFGTSTISDYAFDAGSGTALIVNTAGAMAFTDTTNKRFYHSALGRPFGSAVSTVGFYAGSNLTSGFVASTLKRVDSSNYLMCKADGVSGQLQIIKVVAGTPTTLATVAQVLPAGQSWIRSWIDDNRVVVELWASTTTALNEEMAGPSPLSSVSYDLTGGDITQFGSGVLGQYGVNVTPGATDWSIFEFDVDGIDPCDVYMMCRKSSSMAIKESQVDGRYRRDFLITLRASDPRWYSTAELNSIVTVVSNSERARTYDKSYDEEYDTFIDVNGVPLATTPNALTVNNRGNFRSEPTIVLSGAMTNPTLVNFTNGEQVSINATLNADSVYTLDLKNRTMTDESGLNVFQALDPSSDRLALEPGANVLALAVSAFSGAPTMKAIWRSAWM